MPVASIAIRRRTGQFPAAAVSLDLQQYAPHRTNRVLIHRLELPAASAFIRLWQSAIEPVQRALAVLSLQHVIGYAKALKLAMDLLELRRLSTATTTQRARLLRNLLQIVAAESVASCDRRFQRGPRTRFAFDRQHLPMPCAACHRLSGTRLGPLIAQLGLLVRPSGISPWLLTIPPGNHRVCRAGRGASRRRKRLEVAVGPTHTAFLGRTVDPSRRNRA